MCLPSVNVLRRFPQALLLALVMAGSAQVLAASPEDDHDHGPSASGGLVLDAAAIKANSAAPIPKQIRPEVVVQVNKLLAAPQVRQALELLKADETRFIQEAIQLTEIPAPTFAEFEKAKAFSALLRACHWPQGRSHRCHR